MSDEAGTEAATHQGHVRQINQDAYLARPEIGLWAVADGIGGMAHGEKASRAIVNALAGVMQEGTAGDLIATVDTCLTRVNDDLRWEAQMGVSTTMIGSTVVVLLIEGARFTCLWAGDSRLYRLRAGVLELLTSDHTPIQEMIDAGLMEYGSAIGHPLDHIVNRAVGTEAHFALDCTSGATEPDDVFLLCTDGLTKSLEEAAIGWLLGAGDRKNRAQHLVDAALQAGASDNITAVVVGQRTGAVQHAADKHPDPAAPLRCPPETVSRKPARSRARASSASARLATFGLVLSAAVAMLAVDLQLPKLWLSGLWLPSLWPVTDDMAVGGTNALSLQSRLAFLIFAELLLLLGVLLAALGQRRLLPVAVAALLLGLASAVPIFTASADLRAMISHLNLPSLPVPAFTNSH